MEGFSSQGLTQPLKMEPGSLLSGDGQAIPYNILLHGNVLLNPSSFHLFTHLSMQLFWKQISWHSALTFKGKKTHTFPSFRLVSETKYYLIC